jgi:hypothetical protein
VSSKRKHEVKGWIPPTDDKMAIADARETMPMSTDKKPAKKKTPARKAAPAPQAPAPPAAPAAPGQRGLNAGE